MSDKEILHFTGMKCTKYGSLERYFIELIKFCNKQNYKTILQYESCPESEAYVNDLKALDAELIVLPTFVDFFHTCTHVGRLINSVRPEIIHTHFIRGYAKVFIPFFAKVLGVKKIVSTVHCTPAYTKKHPCRFVYNLFDHVLPVSNSVQEALLKGGVNSEILTTHYLGLFGERERSKQTRKELRKEFAIPDDSIVLACIAFDDKIKGVDILLSAFAKVLQKHNNLYLICIGINPVHSKLPDLADQLGVSHRLHWTGIIDSGWKLLNVADIYVQPSRSEGLTLAVLEAMSMKLPIVCTRTGNVDAIIDNKTGFIADTEDPDSLANAIDRMVSLQDSWPEMGEAGYQMYKSSFQGEKSVLELFNKYYA